MKYARDLQSLFVVFLSITTPFNLYVIFSKTSLENVTTFKFSFYIFAVMGLLAFMLCRSCISMYKPYAFAFSYNFYMATLAVASLLSISMIYSPHFFLFVPLPFIWLWFMAVESKPEKVYNESLN